MSPTRSQAAISSARPSKAQLAGAANKGIRDVIAPRLSVLFVGINPGLYSAATGHHFARPGNRFWPALHAARFTAALLHPSRQSELLKHGFGITNLVNRATATADQLVPHEFVAGRKRLAAKVRRYRPKVVAFLGVGAYCQAFGIKQAQIGPQIETFKGAAVWVLPNPSGLNANYQLPELVKLFLALRHCVATDSNLDQALRTAIAEKRLIGFELHGCPRIAEPHDYGVIRGVPKLFFYQVGGQSRSAPSTGWRWAVISKVSGLKILPQRFAGSRPASGRHVKWDELIATVSPRS